MRKVLLLAVIITGVFAVAAQAASPISIAVFNSRAIAAKSDPLTAARKKIEDQFGPEKSRLEAQARKLKEQADALQRQQSALSSDALNEKGEAFMRARRNFEDASQAYTRKAEAAIMRIDQEFAARLYQAVQDYGMRKGYTLVLDYFQSNVIYHDKATDVTEDLIKEVARVYREGKPVNTPAAGR